MAWKKLVSICSGFIHSFIHSFIHIVNFSQFTYQMPICSCTRPIVPVGWQCTGKCTRQAQKTNFDCYDFVLVVHNEERIEGLARVPPQDFQSKYFQNCKRKTEPTNHKPPFGEKESIPGCWASRPHWQLPRPGPMAPRTTKTQPHLLQSCGRDSWWLAKSKANSRATRAPPEVKLQSPSISPFGSSNLDSLQVNIVLDHQLNDHYRVCGREQHVGPFPRDSSTAHELDN